MLVVYVLYVLVVYVSQEVHAHLNGSISEGTIRKLIERKKEHTLVTAQENQVPEMWQTVIDKGEQRSLKE